MKLSTLQIEWVDWAMQQYEGSTGGWDNDDELVNTFMHCICVVIAAGKNLKNNVDIKSATNVLESFKNREKEMENMMDQVLRHKMNESYEAILEHNDGFEEIKDSINPLGFDTKVLGA